MKTQKKENKARNLVASILVVLICLASMPALAKVDYPRTERQMKKSVMTMIHAHLSEIRNCYVDATTDEPDLEARVVVRVTIFDGIAEAEIIDANIDNPDFENCVCGLLEKIDYPLTDWTMSFRIPLVFRSTTP